MATKQESERLTAHEIFEQVIANARGELQRTSRALAFSGLAGGLTMGLTGLSVAGVRAVFGDTPAAHFTSYLFYPAGFIAVIIGRAQLFTENTLYPVVLVLGKPRYLGNTLRLWGTVFGANVAGAFAFGLLAIKTTALKPEVALQLIHLGSEAVGPSAAALFWSGVVGGWIIALVAWLVSASHWTIGQIAVIWLLTFIVGVGRFAHCIAGSGEIISSVLAGQVAAGSYLHWLCFATLGNIVGGVTLVSLLNWGQVLISHGDVFETEPEEPARKAA